jgi:hypothetical protein
MKNTLLLGIALVASALACLAGTPTYLSKNATGTTSAEVIFLPDPSLQIRMVGCIGTSDKAASVFSFRTGTGAYVVTSATVNATNIVLNSTNGIGISTNIIIVTGAGVASSATTHSALSGTSTNVWITATNSIVPAVGDQVYLLGPATTIKCGATTGNYQGEAIYVGNPGRPVRCVLDGTSACSIDSLTARYE